MRPVRVAVVQQEVESGLAGALARTAQLTSDAARAGATLVAFPETWIPGYPAWLDVCRDAAPAVICPIEIVHAYVAPTPASGIEATQPVEFAATNAGAVIVTFGAAVTVSEISFEMIGAPHAGTTVTTRKRGPVPPMSDPRAV